MLPLELGSAGWSESRYPFPNWTSGTTWRLVGAFGNSTWRGSITFDTPPAKHQKISAALKANVYFARPYRSWERGLNENTNGLIRQYIPKECPISIVKKSDVNWIENQLRNEN